MCCCMIETSSVPPCKSSASFRNLQQSSEHARKRSSSLRNNFGKSSQIFRKWSEILGKSSGKNVIIGMLYNKQNITCLRVDMDFVFSSSTLYLTRSLHSLVRYQVEHSKIKFISVIESYPANLAMIQWSPTFQPSINMGT